MQCKDSRPWCLRTLKGKSLRRIDEVTIQTCNHNSPIKHQTQNQAIKATTMNRQRELRRLAERKSRRAVEGGIHLQTAAPRIPRVWLVQSSPVRCCTVILVLVCTLAWVFPRLRLASKSQGLDVQQLHHAKSQVPGYSAPGPTVTVQSTWVLNTSTSDLMNLCQSSCLERSWAARLIILMQVSIL